MKTAAPISDYGVHLGLTLAGLGNTVHIFDDFAPRFTWRFHAAGLTRRGFGDSDQPQSGYDAATLVEDIRQFLDTLAIKNAILVGHSFAVIEMTHHWSRINGNGTVAGPKASAATLAALEKTLNDFDSDYSGVKARVLAFYVMNDHPRAGLFGERAADPTVQTIWKSEFLPLQQAPITSSPRAGYSAS